MFLNKNFITWQLWADYRNGEEEVKVALLYRELSDSENMTYRKVSITPMDRVIGAEGLIPMEVLARLAPIWAVQCTLDRCHGHSHILRC